MWIVGYAVWYIKTYYWTMLLVYFLLTHFCYFRYFYQNEAKYPILNFLPFARVKFYNDEAYIPKWILVVYVMMSILALTPIIFGVPLWLVSCVLLEYYFAVSALDCNPWLYALCPPYRMFYMLGNADAIAMSEEEVEN